MAKFGHFGGSQLPYQKSQKNFTSKRPSNVVAPWHVHVYLIWSGSTEVCRSYTTHIDFSDPRVITILRSLTAQRCYYTSLFAKNGSNQQQIKSKSKTHTDDK